MYKLASSYLLKGLICIYLLYFALVNWRLGEFLAPLRCLMIRGDKSTDATQLARVEDMKARSVCSCPFSLTQS
jgi:hypothetical protein